MSRSVGNPRFVPLVLIAIIALFALKTLGLVFDGRYTLSELPWRDAEDGDITGALANAQSSPDVLRVDDLIAVPAVPAIPPAAASPARRSWAQEMFNYPEATGSIDAEKPTGQAPAKGNSVAPPPPTPAASRVPLERTPSPAERAILERLAERRSELDARARELDARDALMKASEKRLEARINELKELEARISAAAQQKDEGEAAKFKNLITMYDNMKAKDAAKIFDRLDLRVLVDVATQINPRRMSDILAQMSAEAAERLTVEFAARAKDKDWPGDLPKIEGRPVTN
jgi:flagellar motility protein MotE (MotC chaperone)